MIQNLLQNALKFETLNPIRSFKGRGADFLVSRAAADELYGVILRDDLTLNLGLRYDFMTPSLERDNNQANFDPAAGALVERALSQGCQRPPPRSR